MMPIQGLTQGGQPIISYNFGAKNGQRVKKGFLLQTLCCFTYASIIWILVELFPQVFISIFTNDPDLMAMASWAIRIYMACVLLWDFRFLANKPSLRLETPRFLYS